ncbi:carbohydrate-binding protein [Paenibacillus sp. D2_2]|uniref:carbohydrate-binding protein n=1 Tax=Paenibacillus sp. D2_2 TaxID=3073092 RepID=UPI0028165B9A|nr:carbohydrate-binding protein [Paenibacillus sp. D2_2]WMT42152.1 carbohydrate-binding protein [Paenibacillus sp. D2_2]
MTQLKLEIQSSNGAVLASAADLGQAHLVYDKSYEPGDQIVLTSEKQNVYLVIQLEDAMDPAFIYLTGQDLRFIIPFDEKKISYSPKTFVGDLHTLTARLATEEEINSYRNLALNVYDQHENSTSYPHAYANVETRGESVFAARNAINGNYVNYSHGKWPFESWGINQNPDAEMTVDFGRTVEVDKVALTIRADFPHDSHWERVTLAFSDGSQETLDLVKLI